MYRQSDYFTEVVDGRVRLLVNYLVGSNLFCIILFLLILCLLHCDQRVLGVWCINKNIFIVWQPDSFLIPEVFGLQLCLLSHGRSVRESTTLSHTLSIHCSSMEEQYKCVSLTITLVKKFHSPTAQGCISKLRCLLVFQKDTKGISY